MTTETIEIKGIKFEVDLSTARKIQDFKVGDKVMVLTTGRYSSDTYQSSFGVIVGFDWFEKTPNIRILYLQEDYNSVELKWLNYNNTTKDVEISPLNSLESVALKENQIIRKLDEQITKAEDEVSSLRQQKHLIAKHFFNILKPVEDE